MSKQHISRFRRAKGVSAELTWHNGADFEIHRYAQSLQKAAKTLVENLELTRDSRTDGDAGPVVLLYRQALELHLKSLVGEGCNFLKSRTDPISLYQTHSLRWLAQIVRQIIKAVGWESEFTCQGVATLSAFIALINEVESLNPVTQAVYSRAGSAASKWRQAFEVVSFAKRMDALLELLDVTADALAATWDQRSEVSPAEEAFLTAGDFEPTIH
jgi:hypothetical protein